MNIKPSSLIIHNPCGIRCFQTKFAFYLAEFDKRANSILLGPAVRRPISSSSRLNFNLGFFIPLFKSLFGIIFCVLWRASNSTEFLLKLPDLVSKLVSNFQYKEYFKSPIDRYLKQISIFASVAHSHFENNSLRECVIDERKKTLLTLCNKK